MNSCLFSLVREGNAHTAPGGDKGVGRWRGTKWGGVGLWRGNERGDVAAHRDIELWVEVPHYVNEGH